jgi:predicted DNA-binding transcriptional regulator YafY
MSQTERLYWIDAQIRDHRYPTAAAVAAHFHVSERTAFADRSYLIFRLNAPLKNNHTHGGWEYTDPTYVLPFLALSEVETAALRRSILAAQEYLGPADAQAVELLYDRLKSHLPAQSEFESFGGSIRFAETAPIPHELLDACRRAVRNRQKMWLHYNGAHRGAETKRVIRPYHLHNFRGEPHLVAWCEEREDLRQFFLGRILEWKVLEPDAAFVRDPDFDADAYFRRGIGLQHGEEPRTVRVRFSPFQARWIRERRYHPSQEIEELPDGGLLLTLQVAGMTEVRRWLLGYGADAEVLEPAELRAEIATHAKKLSEIYSAERE